MLFSPRDVADYYNQTLNHYQKWWKLDKNLAVHYGIWLESTKTFSEALQNTNHFLANIAEIQAGARILDAGCGVGGSAFFLAEKYKAFVTGITISEKQLAFANRKLDANKLTGHLDFKLEDYTKTSFQDDEFDLVWAIESLTSAPSKENFVREAYRIVKPGGKVIIADYFASEKTSSQDKLLEKWQKCWGMSPFLHIEAFEKVFNNHGFKLLKSENLSLNILPSARRMYYSYLLGAVPSKLYNSFHKTSPFAKTHFKSGKYQYKALKKGLWEYRVLLFEKNQA